MLLLILSIFFLGLVLKILKRYGVKKHKIIAQKRYFQSIFSPKDGFKISQKARKNKTKNNILDDI